MKNNREKRWTLFAEIANEINVTAFINRLNAATLKKLRQGGNNKNNKNDNTRISK